MMKRKRHSPEQIIRKLRDADGMLSAGKDIAGVCQSLEVSEATFHRWRNQYGGCMGSQFSYNTDRNTPCSTCGRRFTPSSPRHFHAVPGTAPAPPAPSNSAPFVGPPLPRPVPFVGPPDPKIRL
jgi:hypothetical protein